MENSRLSKSQSISRHTSSHDIKSSLKDIQNEYAKALEQIEGLKSERSYLKAALNKSIDERTNKSLYKDESISVDQVSQTMKSSYANKALIESEKRVLDLEEENKELKKLVKSHRKKLVKMQEEILSYQYEVDKLGYLKVYNEDLKAEMELLDQEFQKIIRRVDGIDDEKSQSQINQSMSVKANKDFKQTLLKYVKYITKGINSLELKHYLRYRFEEIFSSDSELLNLVISQDFSTLILKMLKLVAEIIPNNADNNTDHDASLNRLSPFSVGEITPQKFSQFSPVNDQIWNQMPDISPMGSQLLPTSLTRGVHSQARDSAPSQIRYQKANSIAGQPINESHRKQRETQSSLSFGTRESKPQSIDMKAEESPRSSRSQQDSIQKLDVSPIERPTHNFPELKNNTNGNGSSMYIRDDEYTRNAAELELVQREKELIQKEKELMEKKKEYLMRSKEINEQSMMSDQRMMSEQRSMREKDNRSLNESAEHGKIKSQRRMTSEADESNARIREDELESRRSPGQLKSILKSGSSQVIENLEKEKDSVMKRKRDDETLSIGSASNHIRSAKGMSDVLREKSRHIAKVLTKGSLYEDDLQSLKSESSMHRDSPVLPRSPVNNYEDSLKPSKVKSSDKILHEDFDSRLGSNETSLLADKKSWFYPKSVHNQSLNNQSKSYHPPSLVQRFDSQESKKDESSNKKVSFFAQYQKTGGSGGSGDQESEHSSQHQSRQTTQQSPLHEEDDEDTRQQVMRYQNSRRYNDVPRGTQYASFSVAFGRTESAERDPSSPSKNFGSIIDVLMRKRIDHTHQTYDVIKGEELHKRAVRDNGSPQYKHVAEPQSSSRRARKCFFNSEDYMSVQSKPAN